MSFTILLVLVFSLVINGQNNIDCSSSSPCFQNVVTCPSNPGGSECKIRCDSPGFITPNLQSISCANKTLKVTGPFQAPFRVICSTSYSCYGTTIECNIGNCEIECNAEYSCFGVRVNSQPNRIYTIHMVCQGPFACSDASMDSQSLGVVRLDCRGRSSCHKFYLTSNGRNEVQCGAINSCNYANYNFNKKLVGHQLNCEGQTSCLHTTAKCPGGRCDFQCSGRSACQLAYFTCLTDTCNMDCSNIESCGNSTFLWGGVPSSVRCRGRASCWGTTFEAFRPALLGIQCNQVESCIGSRVICHGGATCNTMCEPPDFPTCRGRTLGSECRCAVASNCLNAYTDLHKPCLGVSDSPTRITRPPTTFGQLHNPGTPSFAPTRPTPAPVKKHLTKVVMVMSFDTELSRQDFETYLDANKRSFKSAVHKGLVIATRLDKFVVNDIRVPGASTTLRRSLFVDEDKSNSRRRLINMYPTDLDMSAVGSFNLADLIEAVEANPGAVRASIGSELSKTGLNSVSVGSIETTRAPNPTSNVVVVKEGTKIGDFLAVIIVGIVLLCLCGACLWYGYRKLQKVKEEDDDDDDDERTSTVKKLKGNQRGRRHPDSYQRNYERDDEKTNEHPLGYNDSGKDVDL